MVYKEMVDDPVVDFAFLAQIYKDTYFGLGNVIHSRRETLIHHISQMCTSIILTINRSCFVMQLSDHLDLDEFSLDASSK